MIYVYMYNSPDSVLPAVFLHLRFHLGPPYLGIYLGSGIYLGMFPTSYQYSETGIYQCFTTSMVF